MFIKSFDVVYIINLRRRSDRRAEMTQQLGEFGLGNDPRVQFFDAAEPSDCGPFSLPGAHGCYLSHLGIFEREAGMGRTVLILEDDCDFLPSARKYELPSFWDVFYGGFAADDVSDLQNSNIIGSHCMGYSPRAVQLAATYLRALLDPSYAPDARAAVEPSFDPEIRPPLDGALVWFRRAHPELESIFANISVQRPSRSDIAPLGWLDRRAPAVLALLRKSKKWSHSARGKLSSGL